MNYATIIETGCACEGTLTVNGLLLHSFAFCCLDLSMFSDEADLRGADVLIPHADGLLSQPRRRTGTRRDVPMVFVGGVDRFGVVNADPSQGLIDTFDFVRTSIGTATQTGDGTVSLIYAEPDGTELNDDVTVLGLRRGPTRPGYSCRAVLSVLVPDGVLV